ncbi:Lon protease-like 2, peroxisomal, partial [Fragariocoptes setiger]
MAPRSNRRTKDHDSDDDDPFQEDFELDYFDIESDDHAALEKKLARANLPEHVRKITNKDLTKLRRMPAHMPEYSVIRNYLELVAELPWNVCTPEMIDLVKVRADLDHDHFGMYQAKDRVLEYLAVRKLFGIRSMSAAPVRGSSQPILCFVGPPGTGKTSIAHSIAMSLNRNFQRISLGGVSDQSDIRGHRRSYVGSLPGRIIQSMKLAGSSNPILLLDEIDKMGHSLNHGDPAAALLEVLDPEQNHSFIDHYLNIPYDLSNVMFLATANSTHNIPSALLDRMELIQVHGYTHDEKLEIAKRHLVPKQIRNNGLGSIKNGNLNSQQNETIVFQDDAIEALITRYAREAGVRNLERKIAAVCRVVAVKVIESSTPQGPLLKLPLIVSADKLIELIGPRVWDEDKHERTCMPGVAIGMAWTAVGGEIMYVETQLIPGTSSDALVLTGQLGSVMRESSKLSLNWLRANCAQYTMLPEKLAQDLPKQTVHIHFPAGAVGKEGPSAGVTIVTALISLFSGIEVKENLAMTGEITLRGLVLSVGGIKTKVLAAHRAGIRTVILPRKNQADLADVPDSVMQTIDFHFVSTIDEVISIAFDGRIQRRPQSTQIPGNNSDIERPSLLSKL